MKTNKHKRFLKLSALCALLSCALFSSLLCFSSCVCAPIGSVKSVGFAKSVGAPKVLACCVSRRSACCHLKTDSLQFVAVAPVSNRVLDTRLSRDANYLSIDFTTRAFGFVLPITRFAQFRPDEVPQKQSLDPPFCSGRAPPVKPL